MLFLSDFFFPFKICNDTILANVLSFQLLSLILYPLCTFFTYETNSPFHPHARSPFDQKDLSIYFIHLYMFQAVTVDLVRSPASMRLKLKIFPYLLRSRTATNRNPAAAIKVSRKLHISSPFVNVCVQYLFVKLFYLSPF